MNTAMSRAGVSIGILIVLALGWLLLPDLVLHTITMILASPWFPLVLLGLYAIRPVFAWPIVAISIVVGYRYGLVIGLPIALTGAVMTSLIPYGIARRFSPTAGALGFVASGSERFFAVAGDFRGVLAARLAPTPAEAVSAAAGFGRVPLGVFVVATALGELPWTIAAVTVGHSLHELSVDALTIRHPLVLIGGTLAAVILLARPAYSYFKHATAPPPRE